jgi:hypothetical protein
MSAKRARGGAPEERRPLKRTQYGTAAVEPDSVPPPPPDAPYTFEDVTGKDWMAHHARALQLQAQRALLEAEGRVDKLAQLATPSPAFLRDPASVILVQHPVFAGNEQRALAARVLPCSSGGRTDKPTQRRYYALHSRTELVRAIARAAYDEIYADECWYALTEFGRAISFFADLEEERPRDGSVPAVRMPEDEREFAVRCSALLTITAAVMRACYSLEPIDIAPRGAHRVRYYSACSVERARCSFHMHVRCWRFDHIGVLHAVMKRVREALDALYAIDPKHPIVVALRLRYPRPPTEAAKRRQQQQRRADPELLAEKEDKRANPWIVDWSVYVCYVR